MTAEAEQAISLLAERMAAVKAIEAKIIPAKTAFYGLCDALDVATKALAEAERELLRVVRGEGRT